MKPEPATQARFEATRWTIVMEAKSPDAPEALNQLCQIYWPPIYAFIRGQGFSPADAADVVQAFFGPVLEHRALSEVAPEKGKFRSFLQKSLSHFLSNERDRANAQKRSGARTIVSLDAEAEEGRHPLELADPSDPVKLFDRRWALALIDQVMARLQQKSSAGEKGAVFAQLQPYLTGELGEGAYAALAAGGTGREVVKFWDRATYRELVTLPGQGIMFTFVISSPDGNWLAARSWEGQLRFWHAPSWQEMYAAEKGTDGEAPQG
jgi:RNA polymerase sigma-70 factor (ECF subfamily)